MKTDAKKKKTIPSTTSFSRIKTLEVVEDERQPAPPSYAIDSIRVLNVVQRALQHAQDFPAKSEERGAHDKQQEKTEK